MDYEKEYKESFEAAKGLHEAGNALTKKQMEIVFPRLAESEDERIRKALIWHLKADADFVSNGMTKAECIAYLEKQKEQKHPDGCFTCDEYKKGYEEGRRNGFTAGYNKAMKEVEQKEQKPVESISQLSVQGKGVYKICPRCKERMVRDDSMVYTSMPPQYGYECPKCGEMEFDTVMYDNPEIEEQKSVVTHGETYHVDTLGTQQVIAGKMPQKPAEWSEEDEEMLNNIEYILHKDISYTPPTKPNSCTGSGNAYYTHQTEIDWLKSLRSRPKSSDNWKPSEEQMSAFKGYIEDFQARAEAAVGGWNNFDVMIRLYEQLKKL